MFTNGMRSSEFWVTVLTTGINLANSVFGWGIDAGDLALAFAPAMAYVASRGLAKFNKD